MVHDYFYQHGLDPKETADALFAEIMDATGVPEWRRDLMWLGVHVFGASHSGEDGEPKAGLAFGTVVDEPKSWVTLSRWGGGMLQSIQMLRGLAAVLVVISHFGPIEKKYFASQILPESVNLGMSGVDLFFVISGFVMVAVTRGKGGFPDTARFLWNRAVRIFPTYWVYFAITLAVFLVKPGWVNSSYGTPDLVRSFFLLQTSTPLIAVAWSLTCELWFYIVFACMLVLPVKRVHFLIVWAVILLAFHSPEVPLHAFGLEFILGALVASAYFAGIRVSKRLCGAVVFAGAAFAVNTIFPMPDLPRAVVFGLPYAALVLFLVQAERDGMRFPRFSVVLGDASYSVYLSHVLVLSAIGKIVFAFNLPSSPSVLIAMFSTSMLSALLAYRWIELPTIALARKVRLGPTAVRAG